MQIFEIQDIKSFTTELFVRDLFDRFELCDADFITFASFHIDGKVQPDYYDTAERESMGERKSLLERNEAVLPRAYTWQTASSIFQNRSSSSFRSPALCRKPDSRTRSIKSKSIP